jgi:hypothetical protein
MTTHNENEKHLMDKKTIKSKGIKSITKCKQQKDTALLT